MDKNKFFQKLDELVCVNPIQGAKLGAFLEKRLPETETASFMEHLGNCEKCTKVVFFNEILNKVEIKEEAAIAVG